jgi:hypothetical protein
MHHILLNNSDDVVLWMHRESYFTAGLLSWHLRWFRKPDNNNVAVTKENMGMANREI